MKWTSIFFAKWKIRTILSLVKTNFTGVQSVTTNSTTGFSAQSFIINLCFSTSLPLILRESRNLANPGTLSELIVNTETIDALFIHNHPKTLIESISKSTVKKSTLTKSSTFKSTTSKEQSRENNSYQRAPQLSRLSLTISRDKWTRLKIFSWSMRIQLTDFGWLNATSGTILSIISTVSIQ